MQEKRKQSIKLAALVFTVAAAAGFGFYMLKKKP